MPLEKHTFGRAARLMKPRGELNRNEAVRVMGFECPDDRQRRGMEEGFRSIEKITGDGGVALPVADPFRGVGKPCWCSPAGDDLPAGTHFGGALRWRQCRRRPV